MFCPMKITRSRYWTQEELQGYKSSVLHIFIYQKVGFLYSEILAKRIKFGIKGQERKKRQ